MGKSWFPVGKADGNIKSGVLWQLRPVLMWELPRSKIKTDGSDIQKKKRPIENFKLILLNIIYNKSKQITKYGL